MNPKITKIIERATPSKIVFCLLGNALLGLGVGICKLSNFGTDPFNSLCLSVSGALSISYPLFTWGFNLSLFIFQIIFGRRYVHMGTFVNWFLPSVVANAVLSVFEVKLGAVGLPVRIPLLAAGLLLIALGLAIYQQADLGIAPYDAVPLMIIDRFPKAKFFIIRIALDGSAVIVALIAGGIAMKTLGVGTAITALCLGPLINMFTYLFWGRKSKLSS